jgi:Ca-activated chloride channel family protein
MRAKRRSSLLLTVTLAVAVSAWVAGPAPDVVVTGHVVDEASGDAIASVQIFIESMSLGVLSGQDGSYRLLVPRSRLAGDVTLTFERIGYRRVQEVITSSELSSDLVTRDVRMRQEALQLDEVVVSGTAGATQRRSHEGIGPLHSAPSSPDDASRGSGRAPRAEEREAVVLSPSLRPPTTPAYDRRYPGGRPVWNREQYDHIAENGFRSVRDEPLSTFSIDVDRASYSNVRRYLLRERVAPPVDAVQIEEMVNYFSYDYALPEGDDPVGITTELGVAPWNAAHRLLRVGLASKPVVTEDLPPSNLVFLLDVSGSMQSQDKLPLVKQSLRLLVEQLRSEDRVAIVVYAGAAGLVLPPTPGSRRDRILDAIDRLEAGGSTAGGAGLRLAYRVARDSFLSEGNNRVILATDGDFNVGESSDAAMVRLIEERRGEGVFLTVLGFGTGNLQSAKMQAIAQNGNGNYAYIDSLEEARKMFIGEMGGTLLTVAQDVKVQIEFNPAHVQEYRLLGYENRLLAPEDFNDDRKDAGDMGAGHRVTALYEIVPVGGGHDGRVDPLRYQDQRRPTERSRHEELAFVRVRYKPPRGTESRLVERPVGIEVGRPTDDFQFASAVAGFGMILRHSEHRGSMTIHRVLSLAEDGLGADLDGYRSDFIDLVRAYERLPRHGRH